MVTEFDDFLNESVTKKELLDNLQGAKFVNVEYNTADKGWGVHYSKGGKTFLEGNFNTNAEVHEFLLDNNIDYGGKEGYLNMKKQRAKMNQGIPYPKYQQELMVKGIKDMFEE